MQKQERLDPGWAWTKKYNIGAGVWDETGRVGLLCAFVDLVCVNALGRMP
jgi:hypothetical protein